MAQPQRAQLTRHNNTLRNTRDTCPAHTVNGWGLCESIPPTVACERATIRKGEGCSQRFTAALYSSGKNTEAFYCDRCEGEQP